MPRASSPPPLEEHVQFEVARWTGEGLAGSIDEEVRALFAWLEGVTLGEIMPADVVAEVAADLVGEIPVTDEAAADLAEMLATARRVAADRNLRIGDIVGRADLDPLLETVAGLSELRNDLIGAVTASTAYHRLVAHVLYNGVKAYVLTENVFARKIPGASSLVKFGQRSLNSAAPGLERAVDAQLSTFVQANIGETLRDSRRYLETTLDSAMLRTLADEAWAAAEPRGLSEATDSVRDHDLSDLMAGAAPVLRRILAAPAVAELVRDGVRELLQRHTDESPATLLARAGVTADLMSSHLTRVAGPIAAEPAVQAYLESRLRARLAAFYDR